MNESKLYSLLGLCRKAGKLSLGHDASLSAMLRGKAALCLLSQDASGRLEAEFRRVAMQNKPRPMATGTISRGKCTPEGHDIKHDPSGQNTNLCGQEILVIRIPFTMDEIGQAAKLRSAVLTVNDAGFSRAVQQALHTLKSNNNREETPYD